MLKSLLRRTARFATTPATTVHIKTARKLSRNPIEDTLFSPLMLLCWAATATRGDICQKIELMTLVYYKNEFIHNKGLPFQ